MIFFTPKEYNNIIHSIHHHKSKPLPVCLFDSVFPERSEQGSHPLELIRNGCLSAKCSITFLNRTADTQKEKLKAMSKEEANKRWDYSGGMMTKKKQM